MKKIYPMNKMDALTIKQTPCVNVSKNGCTGFVTQKGNILCDTCQELRKNQLKLRKEQNLEDLLERNRDMEQQLYRLKQEHEDTITKYETTIRKMSQEAENKDISSELDTYKQNAIRLEEEFTKKLQEHEMSQKVLVIKQQELEKDKTTLLTTNEKLKELNEALTSKNIRLQQIQDELSHLNSSLKQDNVKLLEMHEKYKEYNARLEQENLSLSELNRRLQLQNDILAQDKERVEMASNQLHLDNEQLQIDNKRLTESNSQLILQNELLSKENEYLTKLTPEGDGKPEKQKMTINRDDVKKN